MSAGSSGVDVVGLQDVLFVSEERHDEELCGRYLPGVVWMDLSLIH